MTAAGTDALLAGRYQLGGVLGRGGMSEVRAALDRRLGREVAVKILRPELGSDPAVRARFEAEAKTAARLSHPNVVSVFDADQDGEVAYIVMERLAGQTLADELSEGPMSLARVQEVARQVLAAVGAAHAASVIHRDIKPANILTCPDGAVKVGDFGIATVAGAAAGLTVTGLVVGTPAYLAPERLEGEPATIRSDLYSVGALLYSCLTGRRPYDGADGMSIALAARQGPPLPLGQLRPEAPAALVAAVERAMARDPEARFASAPEMSAALAAAPSVAAGRPERAGPDPMEPTTVLPGPGATQVLARRGPDRPGGQLPPWLAGAATWLRRQPPIRLAVTALVALFVLALGLDLSRAASPPVPSPTAPAASTTTSTTASTTTTTVPVATVPPAPGPGKPPGQHSGHGPGH